MTIFYRLTDIKSTNESPIFQENKLKLNVLCLKSFVMAFRDIKPKVVFICDYCPETYRKMIEDIVPFQHKIHFTNLGINGTAIMQYELAEKEKDDVFLMLECDYLWRSSAQPLIDGVNELGLVSPYDNLNFYLDKSIHSDTVKLKLVGNQHWRSTERNTMTFALKKEILMENMDLFKKYGYLDNDLWHDLRARGHQLWTPLPSLSTHMVKDYLAPVIPWSVIWNALK